jgi:hypothetical protein
MTQSPLGIGQTAQGVSFHRILKMFRKKVCVGPLTAAPDCSIDSYIMSEGISFDNPEELRSFLSDLKTSERTNFEKTGKTSAIFFLETEIQNILTPSGIREIMRQEGFRRELVFHRRRGEVRSCYVHIPRETGLSIRQM